MKNLILFTAFFSSFLCCSAQDNVISKTVAKQIGNLSGKSIGLSYHEQLNKFDHSYIPFEQTPYVAGGVFWLKGQDFVKIDSLQEFNDEKVLYSDLRVGKDYLILKDYGESKYKNQATKAAHTAYLLNTARYSPVPILLHAFESKSKRISKKKHKSVFKFSLNGTVIHLTIDNKKHLVRQIAYVEHDELFGDIKTIINYLNYELLAENWHPRNIAIHKNNGMLYDQVYVTHVTNEKVDKLEKGILQNFSLIQESKLNIDVNTKQLNPNVYFVELNHAKAQAMVVEFHDFYFVADVALTSANGELVIKEIEKLNPVKPIKYYSFSHYHPYYTGSIRAFVHNGTAIISRQETEPYVNMIVNNPRTISPDNLAQNPRKLMLEIIEKQKLITDGELELEIHHIGLKSAHTIDYLIYYMPKYKLLFVGDLVFISTDGKKHPVSKRQRGLYNAIVSLNLDVETIVQSWPIGGRAKDVISFEELENSMK